MGNLCADTAPVMVSGDGMLGFVCSSCGHFTAIGPYRPSDCSEQPQPTESAGRSAFGSRVPRHQRQVECRCGQIQPAGDSACHRCGLSFAYAATGRARIPPDPLVGHPEEGRIRDTWLQVREHLDAEEEHQAFIQECARLGLLNFAGQCYRELMDQWPDDERVSDYRTRVINAAMAQAGRLEVRVQRHISDRSRSLLILCFGALILLGFAVGYYLIMRSQTAWQFNG